MRRILAAGVASCCLLGLDVAAAGKWKRTERVTAVTSGYDSGIVFINGFANHEECKHKTVRFTSSDTDHKDVLAVALSAFLSNRPLTCYLDGCAGTGEETYQRGLRCSVVAE